MTKAERDQLVIDNIRLAKALAYQLRKSLGRHGERFALEDLEGYGMIGLVDASRRWSPSNGPFGTFAYLRVRGEIIDGIWRLGMVKRPHDRVVRREWTFVTLGKWADGMAAEGPLPDDELAAAEAAADLRDLVATLDHRDRMVLEGSYFEDRRLEDIGVDLGRSLPWVSRWRTDALARLRKRLEATGATTASARPRPPRYARAGGQWYVVR